MASHTPTISREELRAKLDRGDDFTLVETLPKRRQNKSAEIVVYCASYRPNLTVSPADR